MRRRLMLPPSSKPKEVAQVLRQHYMASEAEHVQRSLDWTRTFWHLQGVRRLRILQSGRPSSVPEETYQEMDGRVRVRLEGPLEAYQIEMGRFMGMDISPKVWQPSGVSLDGVRSNALAQATLDEFWQRFQWEDFQISLASMLIAYGTLGIAAVSLPERSGGILGGTLVTIPPWELRPFPPSPSSPQECGDGICWGQYVDLEWLKRTYKDILRLPKSTSDMEIVEGTPGLRMGEQQSPMSVTGLITPLGITTDPMRSRQTGNRGRPEAAKYGHVLQFWQHGEGQTTTRWTIMVGNEVLLDVDYTNEKDRGNVGLSGNSLPLASVYRTTYLDTGSFYARGLLDRVIPLNKLAEDAIGDQLARQREIDRLMCLLAPQQSRLNIRSLRELYRNKILTFSPDPVAPRLMPGFIQPPDVGDTHGKVVNMLMGLMGKTTMQGEMLRGGVPGRIESFKAIEGVASQQGVPLASAALSIGGSMKGAFRKLLNIIASSHSGKTLDLPLRRLDLSLVGVSLDPETGKIKADVSRMPNGRDVDVRISNRSREDKELIEQRLDKLRDKQIISDIAYRCIAVREGLSLPLLTDTEFQAYQTAMLENFLLYNDGEEPLVSAVTLSEDSDMHALHHAVHMMLRASIMFKVAGSLVREAIHQHDSGHVGNLGGAVPEQFAMAMQGGQPGMNAAGSGMIGQMPMSPGAGAGMTPEDFMQYMQVGA